MAQHTSKEKAGLFKGVFMAYAVLLLHLLLVVVLGCVILFFRGFLHYMLWVFLGGSVVILASAWFFFRRLRQQGKTLGDTLNSPVFHGRDVEVSLLGGFASVKFGRQNHSGMIDGNTGNLISGNSVNPVKQLEDNETIRFRELNNLARLLENDLITPEEFKQAKQQIFGH